MFKKLFTRRVISAALSLLLATGAPAARTVLSSLALEETSAASVSQQEPQSPASVQPTDEAAEVPAPAPAEQAEDEAPAAEGSLPAAEEAQGAGAGEQPLPPAEETASEDGSASPEDSAPVPGSILLSSSLPGAEKGIAAAKAATLQAAGAKAPLSADDASPSESVSISVSQYVTDISSDGSTPRVTITGSGLGSGNYTAYLYYKATTASGYNSKYQTLSADGTAVFTQYPSLSSGRSYNIYAALFLAGKEVAQSEVVTISAVKPSIKAADITISPSFEGQSTGSISIAGDYKYIAYYPYGKYARDAVKVAGTTVSGLAAGQYYVFVPAYAEGNSYHLKSSATSMLTVGEIEAQHYYVSFASDRQSSWSDGDRTDSVIQGADQTLSGTVSIDSAYRATHILDSVTVQPEDATVSIDKKSDTEWDVTVSGITGNVTVTAASKPIPEYTITLSQVTGAVWSRNGGSDSFLLKRSTGYKSVTVKPSDSERYYISDVIAEPSQNAEVIFHENTGETEVQNVTGDAVLIPQVTEKSVPWSINITDIHFNENGVYSEENPSIQVTFTAEVRDQFGELVPGATIYFKDDEHEVSFVQSRKTGSQGTVELKYSYSIGEDETTADYTALFSTDSGFAEGKPGASEDIHLVLQRKADLVLYTDQIVGSAPGENSGKVINVPDNYEIWTGDVHQGALVVGSGEWISPVNGEFTGLSAGQHIIRAGEYTDSETNTFYFASDYADFFVPRGSWKVTVDTAASENVVFTGDTELTAEPGGTVYIYVRPEEGYSITSYSVNKPSYVSGGLAYYENSGYVVIEGISGNIVLTVKAEQDEEEPGEEETPEPERIEYKFIEGSGSTWLKDSGVSQRFRVNGELDKFTLAKLDGEVIAKDGYITESGSTVIYLKPEYLETLSLGTHTLTLEYTDGSASGIFTVSKTEVKGASDKKSDGSTAPRTGDGTGVLPAAALIALLISTASLFILIEKRRKGPANILSSGYEPRRFTDNKSDE